jgi:hypothetical protein
MHAVTITDESDHGTWWEIVQQIRKSRAKLGSILEWLESTEQDPDSLQELYECSESIRAEVDRFVVTIAILPAYEKK